MNTDIRLSVGFWSHPKTRKMVKHLGLEGIRSLQVLWLWAATNRPDGILSGMDWEDIELAADWHGEERVFFNHCLGAWIDENSGEHSLHDWTEHNPWQAEAKIRTEAARKAAKARWSKAAAPQKAPTRDARNMRPQCANDADALREYELGNAPLLSSPTQGDTPHTPLEGGSDENALSLFNLASAKPDLFLGTSPGSSAGKGAQRSKRKVKGADLPPYAAWFEECWKAYPRRSGKANAWRAFYELDELGELPSDMVERIKNRCFEPDWQRGIKNPDDERFIPHMSTWLHRRGWEDDGCEPVTVNRNTPEDERRNEIMGLYNFGMPMPGDTLEQAKQRSIEMNLALDAAGL